MPFPNVLVSNELSYKEKEVRVENRQIREKREGREAGKRAEGPAC